MKLYAGVSANIMEILKGFADKFQQVSVDEAGGKWARYGEVKDREGVKSISRHGTFEEDTNDPVKISESLEMLVRSVHNALIKHRFLFKTVTLTVRFEDFSTYTRSKTIPIWTSDIFLIKRTAMQLLSEFLGRQKIRLVGVGVSKLREIDERQMLITDFTWIYLNADFILQSVNKNVCIIFNQ
jgi:nucleotidyltransferase/DNA polymerase involved in DNA repair